MVYWNEHTGRLKALWDDKVAIDILLESVWDRIILFKIISSIQDCIRVIEIV